MNDLILYTTEDGRSQIKLRAQEQTVWLTQLEMAELLDATKQNISQHLKNIFEDKELAPTATVKESLTARPTRILMRHGRGEHRAGRARMPLRSIVPLPPKVGSPVLAPYGMVLEKPC